MRHRSICLCGSRQGHHFIYTNIDHQMQSPTAQQYRLYLQLQNQLRCDCSVFLSDWLCVALPYMRDGNQNPAEGVIRELRRKWFQMTVQKRVPRRLWDYGYCHACKVMKHTASHSGRLNNRTSVDFVTALCQ